MRRYTIRKIDPLSLFKFGCAIGFIFSVLPVACLAIVIMQAVASLANWLGGLVYRIELPFPGNLGFDINVVEILHLEDLYAWAQGWAAYGIIEALLIIIFLSLFLAVFWGLLATLVGLFFNLISALTGGMKVSLSEEAVRSGEQDQILPDGGR